MAGTMVYRLKVADANTSHMKRFIDAMRICQGRSDNRGFKYIAGFHGDPGWYCWHHQQNRRSQVQHRLFLPWHRAYLLRLENVLQDIDERVALPWWDWTDGQEIPNAYSLKTINETANPLFEFTMTPPLPERPTDRNPRQPSQLPAPSDIDRVLNQPDWASFSDALQNIHDRIHIWVGGDMAGTNWAAYDSIFYAHHCMIDRIWSIWQVKYGNGSIPQGLLNLPLEPFSQTFRQILDTQAHGYEYASAATEINL